ncbi:DNA fragmentation factor subunit beta isoform X2 [Cricetulus griseus]|uniref:DNA fragmentation factor subunit beta n=1 Tax=Cricetulus griseus TaxID=10029 RepID=A0A9J7FDA9_CRIGR|nr:DNA fragmentation factor subunit beta isoform X2 [Cricetulus griseus]XP_027254268.1 DNA fragmentation factor subunit beta isoform X2 [Cricetulus griseus]ERE82738.1 DNA fragmentation factor subunit beta [Cricetulus griseus]
MCAVLRKPKSVKLRALHSECKFGVAARSCQELLHKGCVRFQLPVSGSRLCLYEDGTEVTDDYFPGLPNDAELLLLAAGQTWQGYVSDISRFLSVFNEPHAGVIRAARQLLSDEQAPRRQKLLADLLHHVSQNITAETREQDPSWFEGLESRFRNKSGYLRYNCESRIRGYLREVSAYTSVVDAAARGEFERVLSSMSQKLKSVKYNGSYFDRGAEASSRLCTPEGWFSCQGPFDMDSCLSKHSINPYGNRESRILFSTWNLDHIIEKRRTVVPTLAEAIQDGREVNWEYFYSLLFTAENLKLVHIACHKKTTHRLQCDHSRIYRPQKRSKKKWPARKRQCHTLGPL